MAIRNGQSITKSVYRKPPIMKSTGGHTRRVRRVSTLRQRSSLLTRAATLTIPPGITAQFMSTFAETPAKAERIAADLLVSDRPAQDVLAQAGELVHFISAQSNVSLRRTLIGGFRTASSDLMLVHHIAMLPRDQAVAFLKDFLDAGGSLQPVAIWLGIAGGVHRDMNATGTAVKPRSHWTGGIERDGRKAAARLSWPAPLRWAGDVAGDLKNIAADGAGALSDAVTGLVDATLKAGKSLRDAIGEAVNFTVEQTTDFVEALLDAGTTVAKILSAAAARGLDQLNKFFEGVWAAGRDLREVLLWSLSQTVEIINAAIAKALQLGRPVLDILRTAVAWGRSAQVLIVKALFAAGKNVADLMGAMAKEAVDVVKSIVDAMLGAGQALRTIVVEAANGLTIIACGNVIKALIELGRSYAELIREAAAAAGDALFRFVRSLLLGVGRSVTQILVDAADAVASAAAGVVHALLALGKSVSDMVAAVAGQALSVVSAVFGALIAAGKKAQEILVALAGRSISVLRTGLEALLAINVNLAEVVKQVVTSVAEGFRRGFFEGLLALGKAPLEILRAAAESAAAVVLLSFGLLLEIFGGYRPLTADELKEATKVFGNVIDLNRVRVGFAQLPGDVLRYVNVDIPRAFTTMYLINFGPGATIDMQTLIHELTHVWQGVQQGPIYMSRALEAQVSAGLDALFHKGKYDDEAAYRVTDADIANTAGKLRNFNPEQQASIIECYWVKKFSDQATPPGPNHGTVKKGMPAASTLAQLLPYAQVVNTALRSPSRRTSARSPMLSPLPGA